MMDDKGKCYRLKVDQDARTNKKYVIKIKKIQKYRKRVGAKYTYKINKNNALQ